MNFTKVYLNRAYSVSIILFVNFLRCSRSHSEHTTLLVVSFDGFRHDYLDLAKQAGKKTPNFDSLIQNGVLAHHMKNAFITKTFPNHWTIATGLYEENHGVMANEMYDPVFNETFHNTPQQNMETKWWNNGTGDGGQPIWFTNQLQHDGRSGVAFWPGSQANGFLPFKYIPYQSSLPNKTRIDNIVEWFSTEINPINFGMMYFEEPDSIGHMLGPSSSRMMDMIEELDGVLGYLIEKLKEHHLFRTMNLLITSDHGMSDIYTDKIIILDDYVDPNLYTHSGSSPIWGIRPLPGKIDTGNDNPW